MNKAQSQRILWKGCFSHAFNFGKIREKAAKTQWESGAQLNLKTIPSQNMKNKTTWYTGQDHGILLTTWQTFLAVFESSTSSVSCTPSPSELKILHRGSVIAVFYLSKLMQRGEGWEFSNLAVQWEISCRSCRYVTFHIASDNVHAKTCWLAWASEQVFYLGAS